MRICIRCKGQLEEGKSKLCKRCRDALFIKGVDNMKEDNEIKNIKNRLKYLEKVVELLYQIHNSKGSD